MWRGKSSLCFCTALSAFERRHTCVVRSTWLFCLSLRNVCSGQICEGKNQKLENGKLIIIARRSCITTVVCCRFCNSHQDGRSRMGGGFAFMFSRLECLKSIYKRGFGGVGVDGMWYFGLLLRSVIDVLLVFAEKICMNEMRLATTKRGGGAQKEWNRERILNRIITIEY